MKTIAARLKAHGFTLVQLGGGCDGWERTDGEIIERILDDVDGNAEPTAPRKSADPVYLFWGTDDAMNGDNDPERAESLNGYTLGDVLRALDDPRDEYYLLSLRLDNGYGKTRPTKQYTYYTVLLTFRHPAHDERDGIRIEVTADSKRGAIAKARRQAYEYGHTVGLSVREYSLRCIEGA